MYISARVRQVNNKHLIQLRDMLYYTRSSSQQCLYKENNVSHLGLYSKRVRLLGDLRRCDN